MKLKFIHSSLPLWLVNSPNSQIEGRKLEDLFPLWGRRKCLLFPQAPSLWKKRRWLVHKCDNLVGRGTYRLWNGYCPLRWAQGEAMVCFLAVCKQNLTAGLLCWGLACLGSVQLLVVYSIPSARAFQANSHGAKTGPVQGVQSVGLNSRLSQQLLHVPSWVVLVLACVLAVILPGPLECHRLWQGINTIWSFPVLWNGHWEYWGTRTLVMFWNFFRL